MVPVYSKPWWNDGSGYNYQGMNRIHHEKTPLTNGRMGGASGIGSLKYDLTVRDAPSRLGLTCLLQMGSYSYAPRNGSGGRVNQRIKGLARKSKGRAVPSKHADPRGRFGPDFEWQNCNRNVEKIMAAPAEERSHPRMEEPESFELIERIAKNKAARDGAMAAWAGSHRETLSKMDTTITETKSIYAAKKAPTKQPGTSCSRHKVLMHPRVPCTQ